MTSNIEHQKEVVGEILTRAASNHIAKKVISAYVPGQSYRSNHQNIKKFDATHQEAAAAFLGFTVRGDNEKKLYKNLSTLSDRILLKIESLFEILCKDCNETYRNTLDDTPLFTCWTCLQGSHNCDKVKERSAAYEAIPEDMRMSGMAWLCCECHKKNDLSLSPQNAVTSSSQHQQQDEKEENESGNGTDRDNPSRNRDNHPAPPAPEDICEAFKTGRCPHGISGKRQISGTPCPKLHPRLCSRFRKNGTHDRFGRTKGTECRFFHPKVCKGSLAKDRICLNKECPYLHLRYTIRKKLEDAERSNRNPSKDPRQKDQPQNGQGKSKQRTRFDSSSSGSTPHQRKRKDSTKQVNESETDFLYRLMEGMKVGIVSQVTEKLAEFQLNLPNLIREQSRGQNASQPRIALPPGMTQTQGVPHIPYRHPGYPPATLFPGYSY